MHPTQHTCNSDAATGGADHVQAALRTWARGGHPDEAAVELLIRAFGGRFALTTWPWIKPLGGGGYWLDGEAITENSGALSGGEQRVLAVVASLASYQPLDRSIAAVMNCDRASQELILAALSHAGGSHEQRDYLDDSRAAVQLDALYPWPAAPGTTAGALVSEAQAGAEGTR